MKNLSLQFGIALKLFISIALGPVLWTWLLRSSIILWIKPSCKRQTIIKPLTPFYTVINSHFIQKNKIAHPWPWATRSWIHPRTSFRDLSIEIRTTVFINTQKDHSFFRYHYLTPSPPLLNLCSQKVDYSRALTLSDRGPMLPSGEQFPMTVDSGLK